MRQVSRLGGALALALCAAPSPCPAAGGEAPGPTFEVSVGRWSVLKEGSGTTGVGAEYRFKPFPDPRLAVSAGTWAENGAAYAFGSLGYHFRLGSA